MLTDKRILKTRTSIKSAFMELAIEKDVSKISVSDLASKALVNRSTFYLHYKDISAVSSDIEQEIAARIASCIDDYEISDIYGSTFEMFRKLTNKLDENFTLKKYIIFSTNSDNVVGKLKEIFSEKAKAAILRNFPRLSEKEIIYPITFAAAGTVDCYINWSRSDNKSPTLDELIKEISKIIEHIILSITEKD